jgi:PAS domain S-box-containing protein
VAPERPARDLAAPIDPRADALARLFEEVHEGIYVGLVSATGSRTLAANPHLKLILGFAPETPETDVRPFDPSRFDDPQAREGFRERLAANGAVTEYLLRLRRADGSPCWVELTAHAEPWGADGTLAIDALMRDVSERKKMDDQSRDLYQQLVQAEKDGRARPDDLRRRARTEQPAGDDAHLVRAPRAEAARRRDEARASRSSCTRPSGRRRSSASS